MLKNRELHIAALIAAVFTFLVYLPSLKNGFVQWDDYDYIIRNSNITRLDLNLIIVAFTKPFDHWIPLNTLSYGLDYFLWGLDPFGFHLTNSILHSANTFLVFLLAAAVYRAVSVAGQADRAALIAGAVGAVIFGVHPMHVESVAWATERKDVLSTFFFLLSVINYLGYKTSALKSRYALSIVFAACAVMSKPMAVSLPVVLFIIDYYPLGLRGIRNTLRAAVEKIPFFAISAFSGLMTVHYQNILTVSLKTRLANFFHSYFFHLSKAALPVNLAPLYESVEHQVTAVDFASIIAFIAITVFTLLYARKSRWPLALWMYYVVTLLPVTGLLKVGPNWAADRYMYIPSLGFLVFLGCLAAMRLQAPGLKRTIAFGSFAVITALLTLLTVKQISIWKDTFSLWDHQIRVSPNAFALNNRGSIYTEQGRFDEAIADFSKAIEMDRMTVDYYYNRAFAYGKKGDINSALIDLDRVVSIAPDYVAAYILRGDALMSVSEPGPAIEDFKRAAALDPENPVIFNAIGRAYETAGDRANAEISYRRAALLERPNR